MVRINANRSVDDRNDAPNKKKPSSRGKKTTPITGVWPCKINGCNKEFAREADLKRHQRTTKLHSLPNYACPQCEATFTRPDALRRHQKSRHNGVVIEPRHGNRNVGADEDEARSPSSQPGSRSGSVTPASKGKERGTDSESLEYRHSHPTPSGSFTSSRPPFSNTAYDQAALPTSEARLNSSPNWSYSHPWPGHSNLPPISYPHIPMYYMPSPHYRIDGPPPMLHPVSQISDPAFSKSPSQESSSRTTLSNHPQAYTSSERTTTENSDASTASSPSVSSAAPVIDPSLESNEASSTKLTKEQVSALSHGITQAAVTEPAKQRVEVKVPIKNSDGNGTVPSGIRHDSTYLSPVQSPDPSSAELADEQKLCPRVEGQKVDDDSHNDARQQEGRGDRDVDKINDHDPDANAEPSISAGQSRQLGSDQGTVLSPGRWLSICLR